MTLLVVAAIAALLTAASAAEIAVDPAGSTFDCLYIDGVGFKGKCAEAIEIFNEATAVLPFELSSTSVLGTDHLSRLLFYGGDGSVASRTWARLNAARRLAHAASATADDGHWAIAAKLNMLEPGGTPDRAQAAATLNEKLEGARARGHDGFLGIAMAWLKFASFAGPLGATLNNKVNLWQALQASGNDAAAAKYHPTSFVLPSELAQWRSHVRQTGQARWVARTPHGADGVGTRLVSVADFEQYDGEDGDELLVSAFVKSLALMRAKTELRVFAVLGAECRAFVYAKWFLVKTARGGQVFTNIKRHGAVVTSHRRYIDEIKRTGGRGAWPRAWAKMKSAVSMVVGSAEAAATKQGWQTLLKWRAAARGEADTSATVGTCNSAEHSVLAIDIIVEAKTHDIYILDVNEQPGFGAYDRVARGADGFVGDLFGLLIDRASRTAALNDAEEEKEAARWNFEIAAVDA